MKKTYIAPEMNVVKIQTASMLAQSMGLYGDRVEGSDALSRRRGSRCDYDDDDEDYYSIFSAD